MITTLSGKFCILADSIDAYPWLGAAGIVAEPVDSDEACRDFAVILVAGSDDLVALQRVQNLGKCFPKKPIILLLKNEDDEQETAAIELGAFEIWTPETKLAPALARLRNQLNMLMTPATSSAARKRLHSPFLRRKQRLLQTLLTVVERPADFKSFVSDFFRSVEVLKRPESSGPGNEILNRLNTGAQGWGLDFLYKKLGDNASSADIIEAEKNLRTFIKTHQKLLEPILEDDLG